MKKSSIKGLKGKIWKVFSEYVRRRDKGICFTCGVKKDWKEMHASHLFHNKLDFHPRNIHACCPRCNTFLHGNLGEYTARFIKKYGLDQYDELKKSQTRFGSPAHKSWKIY